MYFGREMALALVDKVDVFMTTTDTLMQGGGEKLLIEISLDKKIPIISSNKNGIEAGSTLGLMIGIRHRLPPPLSIDSYQYLLC